MTVVTILVPVLDRPHRVRPLVESIAETTQFVDARVLFLVSPGDEAEKKAIFDLDQDWLATGWEPGRADYAKKLNLGVEQTREEFVFFGADDLVFRPGWLERALATFLETHACVVGTNDLGNSRVQEGRHSTHTLVHRDYLDCGTIDEEGKLLHEGYWHNFVDDEFVQTAILRETFVAASDSIVEHVHPDWGKGDWDDTYRKGKEHFEDDRNTYNQRKHLWGRR